MSYLTRTIKNLIKIGPKEYFIQMMYIGDTKAGTLVGIDQFGNKYYENKEEIFGRDRWVDYAQHYGDASQIPPEWHNWMHRIVDTPPTVDPLPRPKYVLPHTENLTGTRKAYRPYNTTAPKITAWEPKPFKRV
ncbi:16475_t:CDS:2 [Cetraspora pellucida]|uniref:16475_t:CDS:1 n=1 Tax=Cetraspora pellucida TaxID=1433469 RepID=A0ACA9L5H1_9GLOM|nr:16475_t:CDS:2 [Cetraspora pellucida]